MPAPSACNWYHGGFFDLILNGRSIGRSMILSQTARGGPDRGTADFVFDTPQATVRLRFIVKAGGDALYAQALLEPREEIKSVKLVIRCYPSAFVSNSDRHVLTPLRDLKQGEKADLNPATESWLMYYDSLYDEGYLGPNYTGAGGCAALWLPAEVATAGLTVGGYGIDTTFDLRPEQRDFRFVFFDYTGRKNAAAQADLRARAPELLKELAGLAFTDPGVANWPLEQRIAEARALLATVPEDKAAPAKYERWAAALAGHLAAVREGRPGAVKAEAEAAQIISDWEQGLPELRLQALLREI